MTKIFYTIIIIIFGHLTLFAQCTESINLKLIDAFDEPAAGVSLTVKSTANQKSYISDANGAIDINLTDLDITSGILSLIFDEYFGEPLHGVSTLDLVLIQLHILGLNPFDSFYDELCADVNNDQRISSSDLVTLRFLILGIIPNIATSNTLYVSKKNGIIIETLEINNCQLVGDEAPVEIAVLKRGNVNHNN